MAIGRPRQDVCLRRWTVGLGVALAAMLIWPAAAQDAPPSGPAEAPAGPDQTITAPASPSILSPELLAPYELPAVVRSLNTPSGVFGFSSTGAVPKGVQFGINESLRYDDNARRLPGGLAPPPRRSKADLYSVTNLDGSASTRIGLQTFFARGSYGLTRYRDNTDLDSNRYALAAGVNWRLGYPCSGSLIASSTQSEVEQQDLVFGGVTSLSKTQRIDFQGRCHIVDRLYGTFGASSSRYTVSSSPLSAYDQLSGRAGLEYAAPKLYTVGVEAIYSANDYFNRASTILNPLTTDQTQQTYRAYYSYFVSPKTTINVGGGVTNFTNRSILGSNSKVMPTYSASINWRATPKILVTLATQYTAAPPQSIVADVQRSRITSLAVAYSFSPKLSFSGAYAYARTSTSILSPQLGLNVNQDTVTNSASIDASYRISPFMSAGLGYRFSEQTDKLLRRSLKSNVYTVSLAYRR